MKVMSQIAEGLSVLIQFEEAMFQCFQLAVVLELHLQEMAPPQETTRNPRYQKLGLLPG